VPYVKSFIKEIKNDIIYINVIEGLINEDWYFNVVSRNVWAIFNTVNYRKSH
jgi:hypothetical protein